MAAALFKGASIGPLIELAIDFDPRFVVLHHFIDLGSSCFKELPLFLARSLSFFALKLMLYFGLEVEPL